MSYKHTTRYFAMLMLVCIVAGCNTKKVKGPTDSPTQGTIHISADESFKPVIDEQIAMYEALNPATHIIADYKPEASCLKDLFQDTATRMVIITRALAPNEEKYLIDTLKYIPPSAKIASDAIAIVVNANSIDTLFTVDNLRQRLLGKINRNQKIVFDGLSATSAVRYITDSVLRGASFDTSVVKAAKNSQEVLNFVSENLNAIGLVGISWIGNPEEPAQVAMLKKVKLAYVRCDVCDGQPFVKPMQQSIATKRYPLVRGLHYVLKENFNGLGAAFATFLKYEQGQLIFRRAYLNPVMDFDVRSVRVNEKLPDN